MATSTRQLCRELHFALYLIVFSRISLSILKLLFEPVHLCLVTSASRRWFPDLFGSCPPPLFASSIHTLRPRLRQDTPSSRYAAPRSADWSIKLRRRAGALVSGSSHILVTFQTAYRSLSLHPINFEYLRHVNARDNELPINKIFPKLQLAGTSGSKSESCQRLM